MLISTCISLAYCEPTPVPVSTSPEPVVEVQQPPRDKLQETIHELRQHVARNGCKAKNFCFALQSTSSSGNKYFNIQKWFMVSAARILYGDDKATLSAVRYGTISTTISMTTADESKFTRSVTSSAFDAAESSSLRSPIVACDSLLYDHRRRQNTVMVLLGDGSQNFGGDPVLASEGFRSRGGRVFGILVRDSSSKAGLKLLKDIVGPGGFDVSTISAYWMIRPVLRQLVQSVC